VVRPHDTGGVALVPVLAKASDAWLHSLLGLGILVAHKFALISLNFAYKVSKSAKKNKKIFAHLCNN
jgi:hypothetical protein